MLLVCLSVRSYLTSGVSVHPENTVTYSVGNRGQKICGVFFQTGPFKSYDVKFVGFSLKLLYCRARALPAFYGYYAS